ncbi:hypothetical protein SCP_0500490 [Sparassis crispa]|uniref:Uncharacterized protein n=1 Tax=Sparassis crispa TaxID=139825 RepID=A0A401GLF6_9APHY|nr:hypothetical protein SCP_0500490 [Sparassis crispa]GBE83006.1 hypothetical protein SCP_0500490 [Sparassis crispa]
MNLPLPKSPSSHSIPPPSSPSFHVSVADAQTIPGYPFPSPWPLSLSSTFIMVTVHRYSTSALNFTAPLLHGIRPGVIDLNNLPATTPVVQPATLAVFCNAYLRVVHKSGTHGWRLLRNIKVFPAHANNFPTWTMHRMYPARTVDQQTVDD